MTTLPTSPFPELRPLEESRQVPGLAELLSSQTSLPVDTAPPPSPQEAVPPPAPPRPPLGVSRFPTPQDIAAPEHASPAIFAEMPVVPQDQETSGSPPSAASIAEYMAVPVELEATPEPAPVKQFPRPFPQPVAPPETNPSPGQPRVTPPAPTKPASLAPVTTEPATTDEDLQDALLPILTATLEKALYAPETGLHTYLEPMLRSTIRRAIAEQMESSSQFRSIGAADRLAWRLSALFTSRSYDEIVFDRTRRYQVEEVYLLRKTSHSLISFASHDPVRHTSQRRIESTVKMLASKLSTADGHVSPSFDLPERRVALVRTGIHSLLVAVLRGSSNALVRADLDYVLRQAEERFGSRLNEESDAFLHALQPILEGALLIQSPAPPR